MSRIDDLIAEFCPEGVAHVPLCEVGIFERGNGMEKKLLISKGLPAIHYGEIHMRYGVYADQTFSFVSEDEIKGLRVAEPGDLVIATTSEDIEGAIWRLSHFLQQYFGGPTTYSEQRGHPRLRMRHAAFAINPHAKERWLVHMRSAVTTLNLAPMDDSELSNYLESAALSMVNTFEA